MFTKDNLLSFFIRTHAATIIKRVIEDTTRSVNIGGCFSSLPEDLLGSSFFYCGVIPDEHLCKCIDYNYYGLRVSQGLTGVRNVTGDCCVGYGDYVTEKVRDARCTIPSIIPKDFVGIRINLTKHKLPDSETESVIRTLTFEINKCAACGKTHIIDTIDLIHSEPVVGFPTLGFVQSDLADQELPGLGRNKSKPALVFTTYNNTKPQTYVYYRHTNSSNARIFIEYQCPETTKFKCFNTAGAYIASYNSMVL